MGGDDPKSRRQLPVPDSVAPTLMPTAKTLGVLLDASFCGNPGCKCSQTGVLPPAQVRQLALCLSSPDLAMVIYAAVTSRLEYCNSLYIGLPLEAALETAACPECSGPGTYRYPSDCTYSTCTFPAALAPR